MSAEGMLKCVIVALGAAAPALGAAEGALRANGAAAAQFEAIKKLAGEWSKADEAGQPAGPVVSSIRVTAGGSAVQETLFPGTEREMVTLYHLDRGELVLTHYCMLGNQPRMRAEPGEDAGPIEFKCAGGGNLQSEDDKHMHHLRIKRVDDDHLEADWTLHEQGKPVKTVELRLVRKDG